MLSCSTWFSAVHHPNRTHDLHSGSQNHYPSTNWVEKTTRCNFTSSAPGDVFMRPKHVELRIHQLIYIIASSWHFTLLHDEDTRQNNPKNPVRVKSSSTPQFRSEILHV